MRQLKLWLAIHDIEILDESFSGERVLLNLRLPGGATLPAVLRKQAVEENPENAIRYLELVIEKLAV